MILDLAEIVFDSVYVNQTFLQVLAPIEHSETICHLLLNMDHVVQDLFCFVFISLKIHCWVLIHALQASHF